MEKNLLAMKDQEEGVISETVHPDLEMQRRLLDLGFFRGTTIKKVLISPKADPVAYKLRGTTIALRNIDAQYVLLEVENGQ